MRSTRVPCASVASNWRHKTPGLAGPRLARVQVPSQCNHVRACGLFNPLDAFCTNYPDLNSAEVAKNRLASRSAPFRHQQSNKAANQQAEQCAAFCEASSGSDAYVLKCLCHQLVWSSDADKNLKARVCAVISASMSLYAFKQLSKMPHISELQQRISKADMIWLLGI
ncbi:hypothetical protein ABBQ38_008797 [Trebouxia sp. C0009 RCD-2024]